MPTRLAKAFLVLLGSPEDELVSNRSNIFLDVRDGFVTGTTRFGIAARQSHL